jgi:predicted Ser/Thr protein kinase
MAKNIPSQIGRFRIIGTLGKGGMGDVYKAVQEPLNRVVALKVLPEEYSRNEEFLKRFISEAKAISQLEHQNIVGIYDYGVDGNLRYIAMRYIDGVSLGEKLEKEKTLPVPLCLEYTRQICRALKYAHEHDIVHRDIKPQNILIQHGDKLFVTDFGISKMVEQTGFTRTGVVVGTPEYMSPEQAEGLKLNGQTDIYSLGAVLYEMLTGGPPFTGDSPLSIAYKHVNLPPPPPSEKRKDIPKRLELMILKALKKDRAYRYKNMDEFLEDLDRVNEAPPLDDKTRGMALADGFKREKLFLSEQRVVDRRSSERRRDSRRGYFRRTADDGRRKRLPSFLFGLMAALLGGFIVFSILWRVNSREKPLDGKSGIRTLLGSGNPGFALDERVETCWKGLGPAPSLIVEFTGARPSNRIDVQIGNNAAQDSFALFARPRKIAFLFNESLELTADLADTRDRQVIVMPEPLDLRRVKLTVLDVYPGSLYTDVCLSEVKFWKSPQQ